MTPSDVRLIVPPMDEEPWPTLGPELCDWLEVHLVHGPGDCLGDPVELTDEVRLFLYRAYEIFPRGHDLEGRRRFKRIVLSRRKGMGKTELASMIAIAEMDPTAPVRCDGFRKDRGDWVPVGRSVRDPYIPMVATTEEQSDELAYGTAKEILLHCQLGNEYDVGEERIMHRSEPGKMQALASAPSARDGARTTFQHFDETHLFVSDRLKGSHATMLRNVPKRVEADAWSLETTTMYEPGEDSVAEGSHGYALDVAAGRLPDSRLYFDHRQASTARDLSTKRGLLASIREASGDALSFTDVETIASTFHDPQTDEQDFRRYWLNQRVKGSRRWISIDLVKARQRKRQVDPEIPIVLAFDGSYNRDSTALVGCTVEERPYLFVLGKWIRPAGASSWRVPKNEVVEAIEEALEGYEVVEFAPDPPGWHREIEDVEEAYGEVVVRFETIQPRRMGPACDDFQQAMRDDELDLEPDEDLLEHFGNGVPVNRRGYIVITKSAPDSPDKIDLAVGAIVAYHRARWHYTHEGEDVVAFVVDPREPIPA